MIHRDLQTDGTLRLSTEECSYTLVRPRPGTLLLTIRGREMGSLGRAPLGEVAAEAALHPPLQLFIDMSELSNVSEAVSNDWTAWFQANQHAVRKVVVLAPEPFVRLVVAVSQVFSRTGDLIRIYTEPDPFVAAVRKMVPAFSRRSAGGSPARQ